MQGRGHIIILSTLLLSVNFFEAFAQSREMGIMLGTMGYRGDLDATMYDTRYLNPAIGAIYRRSYSNHWVFKATAGYGRIEGSDANAEDLWSRNRNLSFRSSIFELGGHVEFNFFPYQTANPFSAFTPYLLCGFTGFHFNPKAEVNNEWVALQPLGTEGQGTEAYPELKPYKRTTMAFTFGGGFKFKIMKRFGMAIETGVRQTYTDYLDDVSGTYADPLVVRREYGKIAGQLSDRSLVKPTDGNTGRQRGDKNRKDFYVFTGVQFTYTLSKKYIDSCRPFKIKLW